ncbi:hypothetical protein BX666DRAFT_609843 [Dichotomocladium elegans]|nr:hypothetical protein BX666DRAFT_609843 [Dichotomocladium elegans]
MTSHVVYAIHNFEAENDDEIDFRIGDPIVVVERDDKYMDGWWQGRNIHGHTGLFPMNYVSSEKPQTHYKPENTFSTVTATNNDMPASKLDSSVSSSQFSSSCRPQSKPETWTTEQVANWLKLLGHGALSPIFIEQEITGDILLDLSMDAMKELGISTYGKRHKIMHAIAELKNSSANGLTSAKRHYRASRALPNDPPSPAASSSNGSISSSQSRTVATDEHSRPGSPHSMLSSPSISRSNTFNTMSSKRSTSTASGTLRSIDHSRFISAVRGPPSQHQPESMFDGMTTYSSASSTLSKSNWMADSNVSSASSMEHHASSDTELSSQKPSNVDDDIAAAAAAKSPHQNVNSNANAPQDGFQVPEHEGWLHKQGDRYKTWNKRWFVLKGSNLFYFKSPKDVRMKGIINLRGYRVVVDEAIHNNKYCFKVQHDRERTFCFYTDSEESMRKWVNVLMKTTIARDISSPVVSSNPVATVSLEVARRMRPRPPSMIMYNSATNTVSNSKSTPLPQTSGGSAREDDMSHRSKMGMVAEEETGPEQYIAWINSHVHHSIQQLRTAFRDGEQLIELLESLSGKRVPRPHVGENERLGDMHMLDTLVAAFKFMGREGIDVDGGFTIKDIFGGEEDKILMMLDAIRARWSSVK